MGEAGKRVMLVALDDGDHSYYALEWALDHFFTPYEGFNLPFKLMLVHARPAPKNLYGYGPGTVSPEVTTLMDHDSKKTAQKVIDKAKEICIKKSVIDISVEVAEGDPRDVLTQTVEKHKADTLVLGSHGYGAVKRAVLGSVSDYCAHHCNCSIMIVKKSSRT